MQTIEVFTADLPTIFARPALPQLDLPRVSPDMSGLNAVAQGLEAVAKLGEVARKQQQVVDFDKASTEYTLAMDEFQRTLPQEENTALWEAQHARADKDTRARILKNISDPQTRRLLERQFEHEGLRGTLDVRTAAQTMANQQRIAYADRAGEELSKQAADELDPTRRQEIIDRYHGIIGGLSSGPVPAIHPQAASKRLLAFDKQVSENRFYNDLELNPSMSLKQLKAGSYGEVEPEKRRQWEIQANSAIRQGILDQERELKLEREKADLNLQKMIDAGATQDQIASKLKEYTAVGIYGRDERYKIEQQLVAKDSPQQFANGEQLLADFNSNYPDPARVKAFRDRANAMRASGEIGNKGAAMFLGHINQVQQALIREARAAAADARRENPQISKDEAAKIIGQNYPYESPTDTTKWTKSHREDVQAYNALTQGKSDANRKAAAEKVRDDRAKANQLRKANLDRRNALPKDEQAALDALNPQPTKVKP